jgi:TPR repeat protein
MKTGYSADMSGNPVSEQTLIEAEDGSAAAQFILGYYYFSGRGEAKNVAEAVRWFCKAAKQGNAVAEYNLDGGVLGSVGLRNRTVRELILPKRHNSRTDSSLDELTTLGRAEGGAA